MTFRELWLEEANKATGMRRRRMLRISENPKAMRRLEQAARDKAGLAAGEPFKAVDWQKILPILLELLPVLLKLFGL